MSRPLKSGPNVVDDSRWSLVQAAKKKMNEFLPFNDENKISDDDLIIRFLVARNWDIEQSTSLLCNYLKWREEYKTHTIFTESFPKEVETLSVGFGGLDKEGNPIYYECPDPKAIATVVGSVEKNRLMRWHVYVLERARQRYQRVGGERVTIVLDASKIGLNLLTNTTAVSLLKEMAAFDQTHYPEHMRYMFIINAPYYFASLYSVVKPMLDERVKQKIHIWKSNYLRDIQQYIDLDQLSCAFGGTGPPIEYLKCDPRSYALPALKNPPIEEVNDSILVKAHFQSEEENPSTPLHHARADSFEQDAAEASDDEFQTCRSASDEEEKDLPSPRTGVSEPDSGSPAPPSPQSESQVRSSMKIVQETDGQGWTMFKGVTMEGAVIGQAYGNSIVKYDGLRKVLLAELQVEEGHVVHSFIQLHDKENKLRFILKRRRLHREIMVFLPNDVPYEGTATSYNAAMLKSSSVKHKIERLKSNAKGTPPRKLHCMSCFPVNSSALDWVLRAVNGPRASWEMRYVGGQCEWARSLLGYDEELIFALVIALNNLWS